MANQPFGGDPSHHVVGMMHPLAALIAEGEGEGFNEFLLNRGGGGDGEGWFGHSGVYSCFVLFGKQPIDRATALSL